MGRLFGTDGVRGVANSELTPELAFKLGKAGAHVLSRDKERPVVIIGKDTRLSGDMLEDALSAGILAVGGNVIKVDLHQTFRDPNRDHKNQPLLFSVPEPPQSAGCIRSDT